MGQVRPLINLEFHLQNTILNEIISLKLSSRAVENKVRDLINKTTSDEEVTHYKNFFEEKTGSKVRINKSKEKYKLSFTFDSKEKLDHFVNKLN